MKQIITKLSAALLAGMSVFGLRAEQVNIALSTVYNPKTEAHYSAAWSPLAKINDGIYGNDNEAWGSWLENRPATGWVTYEWTQAYNINKSIVYFCPDFQDVSGRGDNCPVPQSWHIEYWDGAGWKAVTLKAGQEYTRAKGANNVGNVPNSVEFETVNTSKIRLFLNAQTNGKTYTAFRISEWEVYADILDPLIVLNASKLILSELRGKSTQTLTVKGFSIPAEGIDVALSENLTGVQLSTSHISQEEANSDKGFELSVSFFPEQGTTNYGSINFKTGDLTTSLSLLTSKDSECFVEEKYNLVYDSRFFSLDRLTTWYTPPTVVSIADGEDVKCGATCLKFTGTQSGIEMKGTLYLAAGSYKTSGWIKTNGTFETGVYGTNGVFSSSESAVLAQDNNSINFLIPDTQGDWQFFEFSFNVKNAVLGGAWVNNDRNKTATLAYLDNWQIYEIGGSVNDEDGDSGRDYPIQPVSFVDVKFTDDFWSPRIRRNQDVTIPIALEQCYSTGRVDNFKKAAGLIPGYFSTEYTFDDTDIYKILEGMSYSIQSYPNPDFDAQMDELIDYIGQAQEPDGYLFTVRTAGKPGSLHSWVGPNRWEWTPNLSHELYNSGHLFEAAVAHYQATGKSSLLNIAIKNADLLVKDFLEGGLTYEPGHQIVEMGLVKMYRVTGKQEYLDLAKYFLDLRGIKGLARNEYSQSHLPVTKQKEAVGHAVRAVYMYSGMADVAALTNNKAYLNAIDTIWENVIGKKYYITGGIGAKHAGEAFDNNYILPNKEAYCETCAAIGHVYWNHRLFLMHGDAKYYDVIERNLYNGLISGISLTGDRFFYPNPLESDGVYKFNQGSNTRQAWFGCACCPSNLCRFTASVPAYAYAEKADSIYVNLYVQSNATVKLEQNTVHLTQTTNYPWEGKVVIDVDPEVEGAFSLLLRVPGWAQNRPVPSNLYTYLHASKKDIVLKMNGSPLNYTIDNKGYIVLANTWKPGDQVEITFPMDVQRSIAHENVRHDAGKVSLERGPIVYCLEWPDNNGKVLNSVIDDGSAIKAVYEADKLSGIVSLNIAGKAASADGKSFEDKQLTAIPYYAWDNRGVGEMAVWINRSNNDPSAIVKNASSDQIGMYVDKRILTLNRLPAHSSLSIYDVTGKEMVRTHTEWSDVFRIALPPGVFLVSVNNSARAKVMVY